MSYSNKVRSIMKRYSVGMKRMSALTEISINKLNEIILETSDPSAVEKQKIEMCEKALKGMCKGVDYSSEIEYQINVISEIKKRIVSRIKLSDPVVIEDVSNMVDAVVAESMYLGLFYDDNNQECLVEEQVRKVRNGK